MTLFLALVLCFGLMVFPAQAYTPDYSPVRNRIQIYSQWNGDCYKIMYYSRTTGAPLGELGGHGCGLFALCHMIQWCGYDVKDREEPGYKNLPIRIEEVISQRTCDNMTPAVNELQKLYPDLRKYSSSTPLSTVLREGGAAVLLYSGHFILAADISPDGQYVHIIDSCVPALRTKMDKWVYDTATSSFKSTTVDQIAVRSVNWTSYKGSSGYQELKPGNNLGGGDYWITYSNAASWCCTGLMFKASPNPVGRYLSGCTYTQSYGSITMKSNVSTYVRSLPCQSSVDSSSQAIEYATGKTYTLTGYYRNTAYEYWARVLTADGKIGYVLNSHVASVTQSTTDVTLTGETLPTNIQRGNSFGIRGTISSSYRNIKEVRAYIVTKNVFQNYRSDLVSWNGIDSSLVNCGGTTFTVNAQSYSLSGPVDAQMVFGSLASGEYYYCVYARVNTYVIDPENENGYTLEDTAAVIEQPFKVSSGASISATYSNLSITDITSNSAGMTYRCDLTGCLNDVVSYIGVNLYDANGNFLRKTNTKASTLSGKYSYFYSATPHPITGLDPNTTYQAQMYAIVDGTEVDSSRVTFTTLAGSSGGETLLDVNYTVTVSNVTATSASVSQRCDLPSDVFNNVVTYYGIFLYDSAGNEIDTVYLEDPPAFSGKYHYFYDNNLPINNLAPNTKYSVRVKSVVSGKTYCSDFVEFTTTAMTSDVDYFNYSKEPVNDYLILMNGDATLYTTPNTSGPVATATYYGVTATVAPRYYVVYADYIGANRSGEYFYHLSGYLGIVSGNVGGNYIKAELAEDIQPGRYVVSRFTDSSTTTLKVRATSDPSSTIIAQWSTGTPFNYTGEKVFVNNTAMAKVVSGSTVGWANIGYLVYDATHVHTFGNNTTIEEVSCVSSGLVSHTCTTCGYEEIVEVPALGHIPTHFAAVAANSTSDGNIEYWKCGLCGKYFADSACRNEIAPADVIIPATGQIICGDTDGNGAVNASDVLYIMRYLVGKAPAGFDLLAADFNGDGKINSKDVLTLMLALVNGEH